MIQQKILRDIILILIPQKKLQNHLIKQMRQISEDSFTI